MAPRRSMLLKIIVLGDFGVGKTSLMHQFVDKKFSDDPKTMIGADFLTKEMHFENRLFILQIWDTAGQERYKNSIGTAFYHGVDCCVLTYDVNDLKSFKNLKGWRDEFLKNARPAVPENLPFVLVGNRIDIDGGKKRMVEEKTARDWCKSNGNIPYFETSAKNGTNVEEVFQCIAKDAIVDSYQDVPVPFDLVLPDDPTPPKPSCC